MATPMTDTQAELAELTRELLGLPHDALDARNAIVRKLEGLQKRREESMAAATPPPVEPALPIASPLRRRTPRPVRVNDGGAELPCTWGEDYRGLPNEFCRAGLFNVRRSEPRQHLENEQIAAQRNTIMLYTGEELRIREEDVLMQVYHFQRNVPLGTPWCVNGRDFLKAMRWSDGKRGYADLYESLLRLSKGHLTILRRVPPCGDDVIPEGGVFDERNSFVMKAGALLDIEVEHGVNGSASRITVTLNKRTGALWRSMGYTVVDWNQRLQLSSPLARFLHRYYASHEVPYALKVESVLRLTGSSTSSLSKFRQTLREAMSSLVRIGFLLSFWIDSRDLLHVRRSTDAALRKLSSTERTELL